MRAFSLKETIAPTLSLFTSAGTLVCCAMPALFVSLGMGASLAGFLSDYPQIIWLSKYKAYVFGFAAIMLALSGWIMWQARNLPCPADAAQAKACKNLRRISIIIYGVSVALFLTGAFFAFAAPYIFF